MADSKVEFDLRPDFSKQNTKSVLFKRNSGHNMSKINRIFSVHKN